MTYEYDPIHSIIHLRASGKLVADDPIQYFKAIDNDPSFRAPSEERIYFTELKDIQFSFTDIINIRDAFESHSHGDKISHGIFIVDSDFSLGMANMVINIFEGVFDEFTIQRIDEA